MLILEFKCKKCFSILEHLVDSETRDSDLNCLYCGYNDLERAEFSNLIRMGGKCENGACGGGCGDGGGCSGSCGNCKNR